jgi:hypothetical protein
MNVNDALNAAKYALGLMKTAALNEVAKFDGHIAAIDEEIRRTTAELVPAPPVNPGTQARPLRMSVSQWTHLNPDPTPANANKKRKPMSAESRKKIAAAQRKRWRNFRAAFAEKGTKK